MAQIIKGKKKNYKVSNDANQSDPSGFTLLLGLLVDISTAVALVT